VTREDAERAVAAALGQDRIHATIHCRERLAQRRLALDNIEELLLTGRLSEPRWNETHRDWEVVCAGRIVDGRRVRARLGIIGQDVWVITAYAVR